MANDRTTEPPRPGYRVPWDDGIDRLLVYCPRCFNWCLHGCPDDLAVGGITHRNAHCKVSRQHPAHCRDYFIVLQGDAPDRLVEWYDADQPDWPQRPEDFDKPKGA